MAEVSFPDEILAERARLDPDFPLLGDAIVNRRRLLRALAQERNALGLSQEEVVTRMATSRAALGRLESGEAHPTSSTVGRCAPALGLRVDWHFSETPRRAAPR